MSPQHTAQLETLGDVFLSDDIGQAYLPISSDAWKKLISFGKLIPRSLTQFWGYEISLSNNTKQADVLFCVHKPESFRTFTSGKEGARLFGEVAQEKFKWLADKWASASDDFSSNIQNLWFEYDFADLAAAKTDPNFFLAPSQHNHVFQTIDTTAQVFAKLGSSDPHPESYRLLMACYQVLEGNAWISQIGRMLARDNPAMRVFIQDITQGGILPLLTQMKFAHATDPVLESYLSICQAHADQLNLNIDFADQMGDKLGVECYFDSMHDALALLDKLSTEKMLNAEKYTAFKAFMQHIDFNEAKPYQRFFSHFKLVFTPHAPLEFKAYTGFVHNEIARDIIRTKPISVLSYE